MKLKKNMLYVRNDGQVVRIFGRTEYGKERPWVCSYDGDWYDKYTGGFLRYCGGGQWETLPETDPKSIGDRTPYTDASLEALVNRRRGCSR